MAIEGDDDTGTDDATDTGSDDASSNDDTADDDAGSSGLSGAIEAAEDSSDKESADATADDSDDSGSDDSKPSDDAPDEYTAFDGPEGFALPTEFKETWMEQAKKNGMSQDAAQAEYSRFAEFQAATAKQSNDEYVAWRDAEQAAAKRDPNIAGADGDEFDSAMAGIKAVLTRFAGKGTNGEGAMKQMVDAGLLDSRVVINFLNEVRKATSIDTLDPQGDPGVYTSYDDLPPSERMGWNDNAEPIRE